MKKAFYLILKALAVLKIFKFLSWRFGHVEKLDLNGWLIELIGKIRLILKFMTSQTG